ncbi:MAG: hypothetical protein F6J87_26185 [Spirulina sp. SIO3F2]|nr:hypothetical protein [Spirulina sp. SIO3F2]
MTLFVTLSDHSYPILDGTAPSPQQLYQWVREVDNLSGDLYIHCAEGHGRTGLFAALLLLQKGYVKTAENAIAFIQTKRPLVKLRQSQLVILQQSHRHFILEKSEVR